MKFDRTFGFAATGHHWDMQRCSSPLLRDQMCTEWTNNDTWQLPSIVQWNSIHNGISGRNHRCDCGLWCVLQVEIYAKQSRAEWTWGIGNSSQCGQVHIWSHGTQPWARLPATSPTLEWWPPCLWTSLGLSGGWWESKSPARTLRVCHSTSVGHLYGESSLGLVV